jgi:hypothetical protein
MQRQPALLKKGVACLWRSGTQPPPPSPFSPGRACSSPRACSPTAMMSALAARWPPSQAPSDAGTARPQLTFQVPDSTRTRCACSPGRIRSCTEAKVMGAISHDLGRAGTRPKARDYPILRSFYPDDNKYLQDNKYQCEPRNHTGCTADQARPRPPHLPGSDGSWGNRLHHRPAPDAAILGQAKHQPTHSGECLPHAMWGGVGVRA